VISRREPTSTPPAPAPNSAPAAAKPVVVETAERAVAEAESASEPMKIVPEPACEPELASLVPIEPPASELARPEKSVEAPPSERTSLTVVVEFLDGSDPTRWSLSASGVEVVAPVQLDSDGRASFDSLATGAYDFALTRDDGVSTCVEQVLAPGEAWTLALRMR
jgi:hypothetical protein